MPVISVLIDSPPSAPYHRATLAALQHALAARDDGDTFTIDVVRTDGIPHLGDGVVIGPGTPYRDPSAADEAIRNARERGVPLVAT
jgi:hypothetical protein